MAAIGVGPKFSSHFEPNTTLLTEVDCRLFFDVQDINRINQAKNANKVAFILTVTFWRFVAPNLPQTLPLGIVGWRTFPNNGSGVNVLNMTATEDLFEKQFLSGGALFNVHGKDTGQIMNFFIFEPERPSPQLVWCAFCLFRVFDNFSFISRPTSVRRMDF